MVKIVANTKDGQHSIEFDYDLGESLADAVKKFGEDIVFSHVIRSLIIAAQGAARGMMKSGKTKDEIDAAMQTWKPGEPRQVKSKEDRMRDLIAKMSPEELEALQTELKTATKAAKGK